MQVVSDDALFQHFKVNDDMNQFPVSLMKKSCSAFEMHNLFSLFSFGMKQFSSKQMRHISSSVEPSPRFDRLNRQPNSGLKMLFGRGFYSRGPTASLAH